MIDQQKRAELAELSLAILMALLWIRLIQRMVEEKLSAASPSVTERAQQEEQRACEFSSVVTALRTAKQPPYLSEIRPSLTPATDLLGQAAEQVDRVLKGNRTDLARPTLSLLRDAEGGLQLSAHILTQHINPQLPHGDGLTLVALFLTEFARRARGYR